MWQRAAYDRLAATSIGHKDAEDFQYLRYRPLYWFGNGASPTRG